MLDSFTDAERLARQWQIDAEDITLIALNSCGLRSTLPVARARFRLRLDSRPDQQLYFILSLGRDKSPFELQGSEIKLNGVRIATVDALEDDDAVLGYWRNGKKVLTLNSNARSQCTGCVFCPNTMEAASDPRLAALDDLTTYFAAVVEDFDLPDMSGVDTVTICTGCFRYESLALQHLGKVREAMSSQACAGDIHFLSSVLTTDSGLDDAASLGPFHLTLTAECFGRRDLMLKESKARLSPDDMIDVLGRAKDRGLATDFTYIVGLDEPELAQRYLTRLAEVTTTFPRLQVYQSHNDFMDFFIADGARAIEYYLGMRRMIEDICGPTALRPRSWENYRPLWYFSFADEPLQSARI